MREKKKERLLDWLLLVAVLSVAGFLRLYRLESLPPGPHYDEAANGILASEIASAVSLPLFIPAYTGKEVLYFYLAAGVMKVLGASLLSLRLTSALVGVATVGLTYWLALELFSEEDDLMRRGVALMAAALMAVSFWHVVISRYGFRAITQPLAQALVLLFLWRGLRRGGWWNMTLAGFFCGATAYTYLASRIVPLALLLPVLGVWLAGRLERRHLAGQILIFVLVAAVVSAPLGLFFWRHPETFGTRMSQVSLLNPELNQGDPWGTLWRSVGAAFGMFTVRGDPLWRFGIVGRPVFDPVVGFFLYLGVLFALYRVVRGPRSTDRVLFLSLLLWIPLLLLPSILGVKEVPNSLRAIGVMPVLFYFPALGVSVALRALASLFARLQWLTSSSAVAVLSGLLLLEGGIITGRDYLCVWGTHPQPYYDNDNDLADAARTLNRLDLREREIFVSSIHYRHPTMAFMAHSYARMRWLVGEQVMVFPPGDGPGAVYAFPRSALPQESLLALLGTVADTECHMGPDGDVSYLIYRLPAGASPAISPQYPLSADFGHRIELLGYDLSPADAGGTLAVTLYWRVLAPAEVGDYVIFAHLQDAWGFRWSSSNASDYPSAEWAPGQIIVQQRDVALPAVAPPGDYALVMGFYSQERDARLPRFDAQGRGAGTTVTLDPVAIGAAPSPPLVERLTIQQPVSADFGPLRLLGFERDRTSVRQGEIFYLGLFWQAERPLADLNVSLGLAPEIGGERLSLWEGRPVHGTYPTDGWPIGTVVLDRYGLTVPHDTPAGEYTLTLAATDRNGGQPLGDAVSLMQLRVEAVDRRTIVPPIQHPLTANLGNQVEFLGYDLDQTEVASGATLHLTLYWRALAQMETSYTVFTHLLDGANQIRGQQDNPPVGGSYPTTLWLPDEVVTDDYALVVDADAPAGEHILEIGLYVAETGQRLPVLDEMGQAIGDRILLDKVGVVER